MINRNYKLGITGCSGAGTSTACGYFEKKHIPVISADVLARRCAEKGHPAFKKLKKQFPDSIRKDGTIDRRLLGKEIFSRPKEIDIINGIIHPYVLNDIKEFMRDNLDKELMVIDMPLLFEVGFERYLDAVLVITCPKSIRLKRLHKRDGLSYRDILNRFRHQMNPYIKAKKATWTVSNKGSREEFIKLLDIFYHKELREYLEVA